MIAFNNFISTIFMMIAEAMNAKQEEDFIGYYMTKNMLQVHG